MSDPWSGGARSQAVSLVLWRHGQTRFNAERRFQGQLDVPLNEQGLKQAASAARYLAALRPAAIFSSDLQRASATADALARLTGLSVKLEPGLRERSGGEWEGLSDTELREHYADYRTWTSAPASWSPPGGETGTEVADRAEAALLRIAEGTPGGAVTVVVSHGGCLGMATGRLLGIPDGTRMLGTLGNARWSVLGRRDGKWRLLEHNVGSLPEPVPDAAADVAVEAEPEVAGAAGPEGALRRED
jgi:broad specificity phosphatase PhoE